jgi:hypothetical protein
LADIPPTPSRSRAVLRSGTTVVGLALLLTAVWLVLRAGQGLAAPAPIPAEWVVQGPVACVGSGPATVAQSGVFLYVRWGADAAVGALDGRLSGDTVALSGQGRTACDGPDVHLDGTWTPTAFAGTLHAPGCGACDGVSLAGTPSP